MTPAALRDWPVGNLVGLLFVTLFGLLFLASIVIGARTLRGHGQGQDLEQGAGTATGSALADRVRRHARLLRDLRAVWVGALVFWLAWVSGPLGSTLAFGTFSFLALREFITLASTRRADHRSLILAFFVVLPVQYVLVGTERFDLFTVFVPVYVFLAIPVLGALAGDPERFLERNAKIQWGITVCVYGLSHAPALLLLQLPGFEDRGAFLLFFLVMTTAAAQIGQEAASRSLRQRPAVRRIDRGFSWQAWSAGLASAAVVGAALSWITPVGAGRAALIAALAGGCGTFGDLVMRALKKDAGVRWWGNAASVTGAVGLLDRVAPLCFAAPIYFHSLRWYLA